MNVNAQQNVTPTAAPGANISPYVVVNFPVRGRQLPADHGCALYCAIIGQLPALSGASWLGIELLNGVPWREGIIVLPTRGASLLLRVPADCYGHVLPLAGRSLDIADHSIHLDIPAARPLQPARSLYARIVTIEGFNESESVLEAARHQLDALGLKADLELPVDEQGHVRRHIIRIHGRSVAGFSLAAHNLSNDDSLHLQSTGIGQHRAMGCGIFNPIVNPYELKEIREIK
jgi:CRISPR-associated endonuclease/helicase Cas3